jgi:hypothetical protein
MKIKILVVALFLPLVGFTQNNSATSEIVETVCKGSEVRALNALMTLSSRTSNFKDLTLEKIRDSYVESMNDERDRIKAIANTITYQLILNKSDADIKYALCQKLKRPATTSVIIASELYFLCRKVFSTGKEQNPEPCF